MSLMPINEILLDGKKFNFQETDLPLLIHGEDKAGGSLFTISTIANLFKNGSKLLCLTGYRMARDEFYKQINSLQDSNAVFYSQEQVEDFAKDIKTLPDIGERVVLIKNIDLLSEEIFNLVSTKQKCIISGDINRCVFKDKILNKMFKTKVLFSKLEGMGMPDLQRYQGLMVKSNLTGIINTKII